MMSFSKPTGSSESFRSHTPSSEKSAHLQICNRNVIVSTANVLIAPKNRRSKNLLTSQYIKADDQIASENNSIPSIKRPNGFLSGASFAASVAHNALHKQACPPRGSNPRRSQHAALHHRAQKNIIIKDSSSLAVPICYDCFDPTLLLDL